jgi:hypothetical protein
VALRFGRIGSSSARSSPPSRRRTRGPPETALRFKPNSLRSMGLDVQPRLALERMPFPSGRPARYGNVRPTDYLPCIGTVMDDSNFDGFDQVALRFSVRSCLPFPYRHPWRPPVFSARPPCTRNSTSIIPSQRKRPWRFEPGTLPTALAFKLQTSHFQLPQTHPAKTLRQHRAITSEFQHHRQRNAPTRFEHPTLEHLPTFRRT